ncbi:hypothetical protein ACFYW8_43495 [Streptomyces sp. NPDC002742]|uniref:hypothetical protein n=1 Tax=Streptomyces sp. NPDC002742 TaxID=3364663 RepID=UPI0036BCE182
MNHDSTNDSTKPYQEGLIGSDLSKTGQNALRIWRETLALLDPRYGDKTLAKAAARAMVDEKYRRQLVKNSEVVTDENQPGSPDTINVKFYANTPKTLHVVLPPLESELEGRPAALRDALLSRTSDADALFMDEWDLSDPGKYDERIFRLPNPGDL